MIHRLFHLFVWLSRINCCRGFGIQSPTDYAFVRYVINEHWPYYAYEQLGLNDSWLQRKLGLLYFRLANWRQPDVVIDRVGASSYLSAGCRKSTITQIGTSIELALLADASDALPLLGQCNDRSVLVIEQIKRQPTQWKQLIEDVRVTISYDLYYCGILLFDSKRSKQHYYVNF